MPHVDPDTLALLALGEDAATDAERAHLAACAECRALVDEMAGVAAVGRTTMDLERLVAPPARVWSGIAAELDLPADVAPVGVLEREAPAPLRAPRRRLVLALAAAILLLVAGITATTVAVERAGEPRILAHAHLVHLPGYTGLSGAVEIEQYADGRRVAVVTTNLRPTGADGHEVWLMDAATGARVGLGFLKGGDGAFVLPPKVDLATYSYVDISVEPRDGNPEPSGKSVVRGPLTS